MVSINVSIKAGTVPHSCDATASDEVLRRLFAFRPDAVWVLRLSRMFFAILHSHLPKGRSSCLGLRSD